MRAPRWRILARLRRVWLAGLALVVVLVVIVVLIQGPQPAPFKYTLRVLGSSELVDMGPVWRNAARATGVTVQFTPVGSVQGSEQVASGQARREGYDAVWFASSAYLHVFGGLDKVTPSPAIMYSPVILGVRSPVARALGWDRTPPTWKQVASAAETGQFNFAMTDPRKSNSGLSTIISLATTVAGKGEALQYSDLAGSIRDLTHLFHGVVYTRPSSGFLTTAYLRDLRQPPAGGMPDGIFDYESQLITLEREAPRGQSLTLIYPSGQALTADYNLSVLKSASPAAVTAWHRLVAFLLQPEVQELITRTTHRRPVGDQVPVEPDLISHHLPVKLPFPGAPATVTQLIGAYEGRLRRPGRTIYVLDVSSSMSLPAPGAPGKTRLRVLQDAIRELTGADTSSSGRLSMFQDSEEVIFTPFNNGAFSHLVRKFSLPASGDPAPVLASINGYLDGLHPARGTWLYAALEYAYQLMAADDRVDPDRIDSIVLISDGGNTGKVTLADFLAAYRENWQENVNAPVYPVAIGDASTGELAELANATGGEYFDATGSRLADLGQILQDIRGFQ